MFASIYAVRDLPDLLMMLAAAAVQALGVWLILRGPAKNATPRSRRNILRVLYGSFAVLALCHLLLYFHFYPDVLMWIRGVGLIWSFLSMLMLGAYGLTRLLPRSEHHAGRRGFLRVIETAMLGTPAVALGYGVFVQRFEMKLREQRVELPGLPAELDGVKLVQVTDVHMGAFLGQKELDRAIDMANETRAHIALMTGDLISDVGDPLDLCLERLARLRADYGVYGCLGNHERYAEAEAYTAQRGADLGLKFLRHRAARVNVKGSAINFVGVDYQRFNEPYLVGTEKLQDPTAFNILLSHNPDVFPVAAQKGFPLTFSGHTHGGQVRVEILQRDLNIARFFTPYVDGHYRQGNSSLFVSRGIGTIGLPARLGAPPEVALITLCRTSS